MQRLKWGGEHGEANMARKEATDADAQWLRWIYHISRQASADRNGV
jgi:hypothetical protein